MIGSIQWCKSFFKRSNAQEGATSFGQKRISSAANFDIRSKMYPKSVLLFHSKQKYGYAGHPQRHQYFDQVAILWKTLLHRDTSTHNAFVMALLIMVILIFCVVLRKDPMSSPSSWMHLPLFQDFVSVQNLFAFDGVKKDKYFWIVHSVTFISKLSIFCRPWLWCCLFPLTRWKTGWWFQIKCLNLPCQRRRTASLPR